MTTIEASQIAPTVSAAVGSAKVWDFHTHLYTPAFGATFGGNSGSADPNGLMLWGIDELLTYHYLIAEVLREAVGEGLTPEKFYALSQSEQADLIWKKLFVEATPLSEACRGVLTTLRLLGLDPNEPNLDAYRKWFGEQSPDGQIDRVLEIAGVEKVTMTNDPLDDNERQRWLDNPGIASDSRFPAVLRLDPLVVTWDDGAAKLRELGYDIADVPTDKTIAEVRRFLTDWIGKMNPAYCAMSLPPTWRYPAEAGADPATLAGHRMLAEAIAPICLEHNLPLALMIGVTRRVNPALRMAGDMVSLADVESVRALCRDFPELRLNVTMLARENQHELAVTARKFANLTPFGCWWFVNTPSLIDEITRMRMELLGPTFIPQHSDARIMEQLLYKWDHSRRLIAAVLADQYEKLAASGLRVTKEMITRDAERLLNGNVANAVKN